jgi:hypothetical protein
MDLWELYCDRCEALLRDSVHAGEARSAARGALRDWGFDPDELNGVPVGLFLDRASVQKGLSEAGFSIDMIRAAKVLADARLPGRLVGPIRDPDGRIVSFWAREPRDASQKDLFLRANWKESVPLFGLDVALRAAKGHGLLIVVEDLLDALLFHDREICNVAAIAGPLHEMTAARWNRLGMFGLQAVVLAPNAGDPDGRHTEILEVLRRAFRTAAPEIYVLPPTDLEGMATPAEFLRRRGRAEFLSLLERFCISAGQYKALSVQLSFWEVPPRPKPAPMPEPPPEPEPEPEPLPESEPPPYEEPAVEETPPAEVWVGRAARDGYCKLHRCAENDCFCFD